MRIAKNHCGVCHGVVPRLRDEDGSYDSAGQKMLAEVK